MIAWLRVVSSNLATSPVKNPKDSLEGRVMSHAANASSGESARRESESRTAKKYSNREEWANEKVLLRSVRKVAVRRSCFHRSGSQAV